MEEKNKMNKIEFIVAVEKNTPFKIDDITKIVSSSLNKDLKDLDLLKNGLIIDYEGEHIMIKVIFKGKVTVEKIKKALNNNDYMSDCMIGEMGGCASHNVWYFGKNYTRFYSRILSKNK